MRIVPRPTAKAMRARIAQQRWHDDWQAAADLPLARDALAISRAVRRAHGTFMLPASLTCVGDRWGYRIHRQIRSGATSVHARTHPTGTYGWCPDALCGAVAESDRHAVAVCPAAQAARARFQQATGVCMTPDTYCDIMALDGVRLGVPGPR